MPVGHFRQAYTRGTMQRSHVGPHSCEYCAGAAAEQEQSCSHNKSRLCQTDRVHREEREILERGERVSSEPLKSH